MIENNFSDTTFTPEDPQITTQSQIPIAVILIMYGFIIVIECFSVMWFIITAASNLASIFVNSTFLRHTFLCLIFLLNFILLLRNSYFPSRYWSRLQKKRQLAFWQPERYLALHQPVASFELPQPTRVAVNTSTSAFFLLTLPYLFILIALFCAAFLDFSLLTSLLISLVGVLMLSVLIFLARYAQRRKPKWPYVEVHEDGIAAALDKIRVPLPWQDICFFATYKGPPTPFAIDANKYTRYYELASHQRIIRWRHQPRLSPWMATRPALDQASYDRWQQQLLDYIKERTGLPLVDLDSVPMPAREK